MHKFTRTFVDSVDGIQTRVGYDDGELFTYSNSRIGRYIFFPNDIRRHYNNDLPKELTIVDVACGAAGEHPFLMNQFRKIKLNLIGVDINYRTIGFAKAGQISYPIDNGFMLDDNNRLSKSDKYPVYPYQKDFKTASRYNVYKFFDSWDDSSPDFIHVDSCQNTSEGRWIMKKELADCLNLIVADAASLPFPDKFADVIISANFLYGSDCPVSKRIYAEIARILKPNGLYLGDNRADFFKM